MDKTQFYTKHGGKLLKILRELPALEDLSSNYKQQAYILMIYAYFEGYVYEITKDFYEILKKYKKNGYILSAHYNFCLYLYDKKQYKNQKSLWQKFKNIYSLTFSKETNHLINTNDNLGYDVFNYLLFILNINEYNTISSNYYNKTSRELFSQKERMYITYEPIINELLEKRNDIAHGNPKIFNDNFLSQEKIQSFSDGIKVVLRQLQDDIFAILENNNFLM